MNSFGGWTGKSILGGDFPNDKVKITANGGKIGNENSYFDSFYDDLARR